MTKFIILIPVYDDWKSVFKLIDNINLQINNEIVDILIINDASIESFDNNQKQFSNVLKKQLKKHDLIIVSDYGHGFISKKNAIEICRKSKFLALNAQVNSSNIGYHTIRNYNNFNTLVINEKEIRHEMRDKSEKLELLMKKLSISKNIQNLIVTKGEAGSVLYNKTKNKFIYSSAFADKVVDKVGAGDTMLSIIGPCIKLKMDQEATMLIGALAAAQSVEIIGNKQSIDKLKMLKTLENFLK